MRVLSAAFGCMDMGTDVQAVSVGPAHKKIRSKMLQDPIATRVRRRILEMAHGGAGSSTDPPQPPYPPQPDLPTPPQPLSLPLEHVHRVPSKHIEETSSDEGSRMVAGIRKGLREYPDR